MAEYNLYTLSVPPPVYSAQARDTGEGVGCFQPSNLLGSWAQGILNPPYGWGPNGAPVGAAVVGSDLFLSYSLTYGLGAGIYKYNINTSVDPITITPDPTNPHVPTGSLGLVSGRWVAWFGFVHDSSDDSLAIHTDPLTVTAGPVVGKWKASDWPWSGANAQWKSLGFSYPGFTSGYISWGGLPLLTADGKLFISSREQYTTVHVVDWATGATLGYWDPTPHGGGDLRRFNLFGWYNNRIIGGALSAAAGNGNVYKWDYTNPASWSIDGPYVFQIHSDTALINAWKRYTGGGYQTYWNAVPVQRNELTMLGYPASTFGWWANFGLAAAGPLILFTYDLITGQWEDIPIQGNTTRRTVQYARNVYGPHQFVEIAGQPWHIGWTSGSIDAESEDPGGNEDDHGSIIACPMGIGSVTYTIPIGANADPKRLLVTVSPSASANYMFSENASKHRVRARVIHDAVPGAWTDWRSGTIELHNLDATINGKAPWPSYEDGDTLEIEHEMQSGVRAWDTTAKGNPTLVGDADTGPITSLDLAPPREVQLILIDNAGAAVGAGAETPTPLSSFELVPQGIGSERVWE